MNSKTMRSNLLLLLTAFIWGVAFVAQSVGGDAVGAFTFNACRSYIAAIVLIPCIRILDKVSPPSVPDKEGKSGHGGRTMVIGGILCGTCLAVASAFQQIGIAYTTTGKAGFLTAMYILIVPILGLFVRKKVPLQIWISVAIAVFGMYLLCINEGFSIGFGDVMEFICAICFSFHILVIDHFSPKVDGVRMSQIQFLTCAVISTVPALLFESPSLTVIAAAWLPILYAGALSSAAGYTLQIIAQKNTDPVVASLLMSLESTFSLLAGWILLHQYLSKKELFGCLLMFIAIMLAQIPFKSLKKS